MLCSRQFSLCSGLAAVFLVLHPMAVQAQTNLPNVVMIMADDLGWSDITAYRQYQADVMGHDLSSLGGTNAIPTPNLDRLCAEGMMFTDAHSPAALCAPTRFSMMTGSNPYRNTVQWGTWGLTATSAFSKNRNHITVGEVAQAAGYRTAFFGKMHFGGGATDFEQKMPNFPTSYGFDYTFCSHGGIQDPPYLYFENDRFVKIDPADPQNPSAPGTNADLKEWASGTYQETNGINKIQNDHAGTGDVNWNSSQNSIINSGKAEAFITDHLANHPDRPFMMYYCSPQVHSPHTPPVDFNPNPDGTPHATNDADFVQVAGITGGLALADMVHDLDLQVGRILATLEDPNGDGSTDDSILTNTLVMFTSDNGGLPTNNGLPDYDSTGVLRGFKSNSWEGGHRVPFIAMWQGTIATNTVSDQLICGYDWVGVMYALTGQGMADDQAMDCVNILPALRGEQPESVPLRDFLILQGKNTNDTDNAYIIRQGSYVLMMDDNREPVELYNLANDFTQETNLIAEISEQARIAAMETLFKQYDEPDEPRSGTAYSPADLTPPLPITAGFESPPSLAGAFSVAMTAEPGSDPSGPVEYLFTETSGHTGGASSGWQVSRSYTNENLLPITTYSYTVTMRDALGHTGNSSQAMEVTTPDTLTVFAESFEAADEPTNCTATPYPFGEWHMQDTKGSPSHWTREEGADGKSVMIDNFNSDPDRELRIGWGYDEVAVLYATATAIDTNRDYTFSGSWEIDSKLTNYHLGFIAGLAEFSGTDGTLVQRLTPDTHIFGNTNSPTIGETGTFSVTITTTELASAGTSTGNVIGVFLHHDDDAVLYSDNPVSVPYKNDVYIIDDIELSMSIDSVFNLWADYYGISGTTNDFDLDGLNNLYEFGLGGDPTNPIPTGYFPIFGTAPAGFSYVYPQRMNAGLNYHLETCTNLMSGFWTNSGYVEVPDTGNFDTDFEAVTNQIPALGNQLYIRLIIKEH